MCTSGKCGICCFYYYKNKGYHIAFEKTANTDKKLSEFIEKNKDKIMENISEIGTKSYFTAIRKDAYILTKHGERFYPCSFLDITRNENTKTIETILCSIHESDYRPDVCKNKETSKNSQIEPCWALFFKEIACIVVSKKLYKLNDNLMDLCRYYAHLYETFK